MISAADWQEWESALNIVQRANDRAMAIGRKIMTDGAPPALDEPKTPPVDD